MANPNAGVLMSPIKGHHPYSHYYLPHLEGSAPAPTKDDVGEDGHPIRYKLIHIVVSGRDFTDGDASRCASAILNSIDQYGPERCSATLLEEVDLSHNPMLSADGINYLLGAVRECAVAGCCGSLRRIVLSGLPINNETLTMLRDIAERSPALLEVHLPEHLPDSPVDLAEDIAIYSKLNLYPELLKRAVIAIRRDDPDLVHLDLSAPPTTEDLQANPPRLYTPDAMAALAEALKDCTKVKSLNLSHNCNTDAAVAALSEGIAENASLTELTLASNEIGTAGGRALVAALSRAGKRSKINNIDFTDNNISNHVVNGILELVQNGIGNIAYVVLERNCVDKEHIQLLDRALNLNAQPPQVKTFVANFSRNDPNSIRCVLKGMELNAISIRVLMQSLRGNTCLVHLDVSENALDDEAAFYLAEIVQEVKTLKRLIAQYNCIGEDGAAKIMNAVPMNQKIELVDLSHQEVPLQEETLSRLQLLSEMNKQPLLLHAKCMDLLNDDPDTTAINLSTFDGKRRTTNATITVIEELLRENTHVHELYLANVGQYVSDVSMPTLCNLATRLTLLDLSNNAFRDEDVLPTLSEALPVNATLTTLVLDYNRLTPEAVEVFCSILRSRNDVITRLSLEHNPEISAANREEIAFYCDLNKHPKLFKSVVLATEANQRHDARELNFTTIGATVDGSTSNTYIREYTDLSAKLIAVALAQNDTVTKLNMSGNKITDVGAQYFVNMLKSNTTLVHLDLSYNQISDNGIRSIANALYQNPSVKVCVVTGNGKDPKAHAYLSQALVNNMSVSEVPTYSAVHNRQAAGGAFNRVDAQLLQAQCDNIIDKAIFDDAMSDFRAAEKRKAQLEQQRQMALQ